MNRLTKEEQEALAKILEAMFGSSVEITSSKSKFNERTVVAVENALEAVAKCNANMKDLVTSLIGGSSFIASGWLKRMLKTVERRIESDRIKFDGFACRAVGLSRWRTEVLSTIYY